MTRDIVETLDRVDRGERLLERTRSLGKLERDVLPVSRQAVDGAGQADMVNLKAVQKSRLHDPLAVLHLVHQPMEVGQQVLVYPVKIGSEDGSEQQTTEPRQRIHRQEQMAERKPPSRGNRAGMPHFKLSQ
jgi:hypothetical protein